MKVFLNTDPRAWKARRFLASFGPGIVTGAADDDPSGISTYSVTGASYGYAQLWTALFSFPLMTAIQMASAKLAMVTGEGVSANLRRHYPRWVLWTCCGLLVAANVINIGADLGGMAESLEMLTGIVDWFWLPAMVVVLIALLTLSSFKWIERIFKWLALALFAYVITGFIVAPSWGQVLKSTFIPQISFDPQYIATFVGLIGTTISPYLFFWQASHEVEVEKSLGRRTEEERKDKLYRLIARRKVDVVAGMAFSNLIMFFVILTTGATLHTHGHTNIETAQQAAEALRPLAGRFAALIFTLGLVGPGMLAVPVLAASSSFAISEAMKWPSSLHDKPKTSIRFYGIIIVSLLVGLILNAFDIPAVKALFWTAILNGLLAPPLIFVITPMAASEHVMGKHRISKRVAALCWATFGMMSLAAVGLLVTSL